MLNRAFITKTTSGELGFRNRKSTRDDLLLTDVGVRFPVGSREFVIWGGLRQLLDKHPLFREEPVLLKNKKTKNKKQKTKNDGSTQRFAVLLAPQIPPTIGMKI